MADSKASDHVKPCDIAKSEAHNRRDEDYLNAINKDKIYIRMDLTHKNESYVSPLMNGVDLQTYYDQIKVMVKEKTGRAMQEKDVVIKKKNGKEGIRKGSSPIRESVVNITADTTMEQLQRYCERVKSRWGITAIQIYIHRDEGHYENPEDPSSWEPNYHAHILWDWMDHTTGKSWKLNAQDMSVLQDMVAETLQMERGTSKSETNLEHLERNDYVLQKQKIKMEEMEKENEAAKMQNAVLDAQRERIEDQIEHARQRKDIAEKEASRFDLYARVAKVEQKELVAPGIDVHPSVRNAYSQIQAELDIPIPALGHKEWRAERKKAIKNILTDLQTELIKSVGLQKAEVTKLGKSLYTNAMKEAADLIAENKRLTTENKYLTADNVFLKDKISKIDEMAISTLRREKDAEITRLRSELNSANRRAGEARNAVDSVTQRAQQAESIVQRMLDIPAIKQILKDTLEKEQIERDYQNTLDSFISEALQTLRDFTLDRWKSIFTSDEENKVCYGILAMSEKKGLDVTAKASLDSAVNMLLSKMNWAGCTEGQADLTELRTRQLSNEVSFTKEIVTEFVMAASGGHYNNLACGGGGSNDNSRWDGKTKDDLDEAMRKRLLRGGGKRK